MAVAERFNSQEIILLDYVLKKFGRLTAKELLSDELYPEELLEDFIYRTCLTGRKTVVLKI